MKTTNTTRADVFLLFVVNSAIVLTSFAFTSDMAKSYSYFLFSLQLMAFFACLSQAKRAVLFLTPIMLVITYVDLSFALGNYAFSHGLIAIPRNYASFLQWQHTNVSTAYVLALNTVLFYIDRSFHSQYLRLIEQRISVLPASRAPLLIAAVASFLLFSVVPLDVSVLGGEGDMAVVPRTLAALMCIYLLGRGRGQYRYLVYTFIVTIFAIVSYANKREAVFLIFPIALVESLFSYKRLSFRLVVTLFATGAGIIFLILMMTILRGYGDYRKVEVEGEYAGNALRAVPFISEYVTSDDFLPAFFLNIETNYHYFHSMNAMEIIQRDLGMLAYGSTVAKALFIAVPSSIVESKPRSVVDEYTTEFDPLCRDVGGSWAVDIVAEGFWNFHFLGIAYVSLVFYILSRCFCWLLAAIRSGTVVCRIWVLFAYMQIMSFARGSGVDVYLINILFGICFSAVYRLFANSGVCYVRGPLGPENTGKAGTSVLFAHSGKRSSARRVGASLRKVHKAGGSRSRQSGNGRASPYREENKGHGPC